LKTNYWW